MRYEAVVLSFLALATAHGADRSSVREAPAPPASAMPQPLRVIEPQDPVPVFKPQVNLTVFRLSVPAGTVSRSDEFWKRIDESAIDPAAYEILYKNGLRVGRAAMADFDALKSIIDRNPSQPHPATYAAAGAKIVELLMKKQISEQIIYDFDPRGILTVRSYDRCDNLFNVEFQPVPRKQGDVRIALCPVVRSLRTRLAAVSDVSTREVEYVRPEKYFHLNLKAQVPLDRFLVVAPSPEAASSMSLGHAMLMQETDAEELEDILLLVPQAMAPTASAGKPEASVPPDSEKSRPPIERVDMNR